MNIRTIGAVGGLAAGAALAFAPLASADDLTTTVDAEISSLNAIFAGQVALAGDTGDLVTGGTGVADTIPLADAPDTAPFTTLDYELYGLFPAIAPPDSAPGAYDVFNGTLTEFYDAYNAFAYLTLDGGAVIPTADLIGAADIALDDGTLTDAALFGDFFNTGLADLATFFGVPFTL
ncbi:hypothetical protein GCM10009641_53630 [Mycobacterium cookii]|uniref:PE family protein n=1 Tax=Mycobacterium cookii TaxID=1775 RepID=A0A7I7KTL5_9MYCO|nr:hypothetical protein [Mycobacterium cookii]MCV7332527.1 hypothetical protein [Mycobacterium cookii]BBX45440.1 hypothetical protein MCOO_14550 [Mycobacterium cookii]